MEVEEAVEHNSMNPSPQKINPFIWVAVLAVLGIGGYLLLKQNIKPATQSEQSLGFFKKVADVPLSVENKPYFLFVGAQFCPSCAAERWAMVKALSRFGTFRGLAPDVVGEGEGGIPTYNFVNADYKSSYVSYGHKEVADKDGKLIPGQELTDFEKKWFNTYDPRGGVPFLFINGQYVQLVAGFSPALIVGKTFDQIKKDLESNADTPYVAAINEEADIITAYLCKATGNQPREVCASPFIAPLVAQVP